MASVEIDLRNTKRLIPAVRLEYSRRLVRPLKQAILKDILRGISPVKGKRFPKYSDSYKDSIRGRTQFFTVTRGGVKKVIAIQAGRGQKFPTVPVLLGKKLSPINLKLSGQMLSSFRVRAIGGLRTRKVQLIFDDEVAIFHNKLGAGKAKTKRRLLPTEGGESFNQRISQITITILEKTVNTILKKFN